MFLTLAEYPWPTWLIGAVTVLFWIVCIIMVLTVLIQKPQGGGLSGAFGSGAGAGQTAFGTKTGDVLTLFTIVVFVLFMISAAVLGVGSRPLSKDELLERAEREAEKAALTQPAEPPAGSTPAGATPGATPAGETPKTDGSAPPANNPPAPTPPVTIPPAEQPKSEPPAVEPPKTDPPKTDPPKTDGTPK